MNKCEVCGERDSSVVLNVPGMPYSAGYCEECCTAGANPYWALVCNTAMCGGIDSCNSAWKSIVEVTLKYLNKTWEEFNEAVDEDLKKLEGL